MIVENLKRLEVKQTLFINIMNFMFIGMQSIMFVLGLRYIDGIINPELKTFCLIFFAILMFRHLKINLSVVYKTKKGTYTIVV